MGDLQNMPSGEIGSTYAITCSVNMGAVFEFRNVILLLSNIMNGDSRSPFGKVISSRPLCTPAINTADNSCFGLSAAANWQLLSQNEGTNGYFDTID